MIRYDSVLSAELTRYSVFVFAVDTFQANEFDRVCFGPACMYVETIHGNEYNLNRIQMCMVVHVGKSINVLCNACCHLSRKYRYFVRKLIDHNKSNL